MKKSLLNKKSVKVILCILFMVFCWSYTIYAIGINIDKPHIRIKAAPGTAGSETLSIKNDGNSSIAINITLHDWGFDENNMVAVKDPGTTPYSCASWIDISPKEILIEANKRKEVIITVRVPEDAVGGHYAALAIEAIPPKAFSHEGLGSKIMTRIISLLLQETEGRTNKTASVISFDVVEPKKDKPLLVSYQFKNEGNTYLAFEGTVNIIDKKGNLFGKTQSKKRIGTFPGDTKADRIEWFGSLPKGEYDLVLTVKFDKDSLPLLEEATFAVEEDIN